MRWLSAGVVVAAVLSLAGCGGGDDTASSGGPGGGGGGGGDQRAAFAECLRKNGVTLPSGSPGARPSDRPSGGFGGFRSMSPQMRKAMDACRSLMPDGGRGFNRDPAALRAFRVCMKDNGAEIAQGGSFRDMDENDPKVAKALKKCRPLLPSPSPRPSS